MTQGKRPISTGRHKIPVPTRIAMVIVAAIALYFLFSGLAESNGLQSIAGLVLGAIFWALFKAKKWIHTLVLLLIAAGIAYLAF